MKLPGISIVQSIKTDIGKVRKENQDSYASIQTNEWSLLIVCDGMGGTAGGSLASILAVEVILKRLSPESEVPTPSSLKKVIEEANSVLHTYGKKHEGLEEMGTTVLAFFCSKKTSFVCHVGDSRLYRVRKKSIEQLTRDHTWVQELVDSGAMEPESAERSPVSHLLTRALGTRDEVEVEVQMLDTPQAGDLYILCTDGLYNLVSSESILECTSNLKANMLDAALDALISMALVAGGKDNITIGTMLIQKEKSPDDPSVSLLSKVPDIQVSGRSGIEIDPLLYEIDTPLEPLLDIAEKVKNEIPLALVNEQNVRNSFGMFHFFLFGVVVSVVFMLFLNVKTNERPSSEGQDEAGAVLTEESPGLDSAIVARLNEVRAAYAAREKAEYKAVFSISPSPLSDEGYLRTMLDARASEFFDIPSSSPQIRLPKPREEKLAARPVRPIVWENEMDLLQKFKAQAQEGGAPDQKKRTVIDETDPLDDQVKVKKLLLSDAERRAIIEEKELLRVRILDTDEKIRQLEITSVEQKDKRVEMLTMRLSVLNDEINEVQLEDDRLKRQGKILLQFKSEVEAGNEIQIAERMISFEESLREEVKEINTISSEVSKIKKIITQADDQIILANKLASLSRELERVKNNLKERILELIDVKVHDILEHRANLLFLANLLSFEINSTTRALGILNAYTELTDPRRRELFAFLTEERKELYSRLQELSVSVSDKEEYLYDAGVFKRIAKRDLAAPLNS
jgi:serine/threonine protein phosphatase PrpC